MTHLTHHKMHPTEDPLFVLECGTNGCDEPFDIVCRITGGYIASCGYWDDAVTARHNAGRFIRALEAFCKNGGRFNESALFEAVDALGEQYGNWEVLSV